MFYSTFRSLISSALDCDTPEDFIAEEGGAMPAAYYGEYGDPTRAIKAMTAIWTFARSPSVSTLQSLSGYSVTGLARDYDVPLRTMESWKSEKINKPEYTFSLIACDVFSKMFED